MLGRVEEERKELNMTKTESDLITWISLAARRLKIVKRCAEYDPDGDYTEKLEERRSAFRVAYEKLRVYRLRAAAKTVSFTGLS